MESREQGNVWVLRTEKSPVTRRSLSDRAPSVDKPSTREMISADSAEPARGTEEAEADLGDAGNSGDSKGHVSPEQSAQTTGMLVRAQTSGTCLRPAKSSCLRLGL